EGGALPRPLEPDPAGRGPRHEVPLGVRDRDDRVVEGRLNVGNLVRHQALVLLLGALALLLTVRFRHVVVPRLPALLLGGLLLARHGAAAGTLPGAGVVLGALAADRQPLPVPDAAVAADLHQALDVLGHLFPEVALDPPLVRDHLADAPRLVLGQVLDLGDE